MTSHLKVIWSQMTNDILFALTNNFSVVNLTSEVVILTSKVVNLTFEVVVLTPKVVNLTFEVVILTPKVVNLTSEVVILTSKMVNLTYFIYLFFNVYLIWTSPLPSLPSPPGL